MADARRSRARIAFAQLAFERGDQPPLSIDEALEESLRAGTEVERYGRLWRMARHETSDGYIFGRIGFEHGGETETWDPVEKDFVEATRSDGRSTPFAMKVEELRVAFQLRAGAIKLGTFLGAFKALVNEAAPHYGWMLRGEDLETWEAWAERIDRVTALSIVVKKPNPTYRQRPIEDIIEGAKANAFRAGFESENPDGLNMEDAFISQAIDQAEYSGKVSATGEVTEDGRTKKVKWSSDKNAPLQKEVPANPATGEATHEALKSELEGGR